MDNSKVVDDEKKAEEESSSTPSRLQVEPPKAVPSPTEKPPSRVQSSNSLFGEDFANSGPTPEDTILDGRTTTPSIHSGRQQVSPPHVRSPPDILLNYHIASAHSTHQGGTNQGRPPRGPGAPVASTSSAKAQETQQAHHTRGESTGELSFMSAITDPLDDDGNKQRQRGVSWDDENIFDISPTGGHEARLQDPLSILQPVLNDEPPRAIRTSSVRSFERIEDKLAMAAIVNPIESEAETAILKALEDRELKSLQSTAAAILPNLPYEAVERFQEHAIEQEQLEAASPESRATLDSEKSKISLEKQRSLKSLEKQRSKAALDEQRSKAVLDKLRRHRRTNTAATTESVENTLYNLATTMRNIHKNEEHGADETEQSHVLASHDIGHPVAAMFDEAPKTQSDALANHAALLFRGHMKEPEAVVVNVSNEETDPKKNDDIILEEENESYSNEEQDIELGIEVSGNGGSGSPGNKRVRRSMANRFCRKAMNEAQGDWETFGKFLGDRKLSIATYVKHVFLWLVLPATSVAAVLYYGLSNPSMSTGYDPDTKSYPSVSWFILFLCVRQTITFSLAKMTEIFLIDFLALKTRFLLRILGPLFTLLIVQAKGWPLTLSFWAIYDLAMLSGTGGFANHWVYYQSAIGLFNANNPSGDIISNIWNYRILVVALILGVVVAIKRFVVGLYLGGQQYSTYGSKLAVIIHKMIVISQVAGLGRQMERKESGGLPKRKKPSREDIYDWNFNDTVLKEEDETDSAATRTGVLDTDDKDPYARSLKSSERLKLARLLDQWEEPLEENDVGNVSIKGILQFKQTLAFMDLSYPFSTAFGLADNRENCVHSSEEIYKCLLLGNPDPDTLQFETLSTLAKTPDSEQLDETRLKELVKVFRPERDGTLDLLEFVRSVDRVYKDLRLLRAAIRNSSQIDLAFEAIINVGFYFVIFCFVLVAWGINPLTMFLSLSSVILAFSFAIGSASAKYFEGLMFILGRNPYDIGDRISINSPNEPPGAHGVFTWYVEKVTLYYTTVRLGATNEVATISNSSLANSRIVNAARSHKALIYINLKFGIDVPYAKIQLFKETVESFVKARPREWVDCLPIRSTRVEADLGFVEYVVGLQHRDSWQHISLVLESKAAVMSFCLEVQKKLGMRYIAPSTPVDLTMANPQLVSSLMQGTPGINPGSSDRSGSQQETWRDRTQSADLRGIADMFAVPSN